MSSAIGYNRVGRRTKSEYPMMTLPWHAKEDQFRKFNYTAPRKKLRLDDRKDEIVSGENETRDVQTNGYSFNAE